MNNWLIATRPKTLFASISPVILGLSIAYRENHTLNSTIAFLTLLCALILQISSNIANDYLDSLKGVDNEKRLGPTRVTQSGLISATKMKKALILLLALAFLLGTYLMISGGIYIIFIGLCSIYFAYGYTGGPFPLSHNGLGEVAAFLFFGVFAVSGTAYLQTHHFSLLSFYMGAGPGFISATILAINNLRDIHTDTEANKRTIAVRFGESFQRKLCITLVALSSFILLTSAYYIQSYLLVPAAFLPLLFYKNWMNVAFGPVDRSLNLALAKTSVYLLIYCLSSGLIIALGK